MPISVLALELKLLDEIAPGNSGEFRDLLIQADERLLNLGNWSWTRGPLDLTVVAGVVTLPSDYESIVGCKIGSQAKGVMWQEIEYLESGPGVVPVEGCNGQLLDQGLIAGVRTYKTTGDDPGDVVVLARFSPLLTVVDATYLRCPSFSALKQMMLAIIYENANDLQRSVGFTQLAVDTIKYHEQAYRGSAKKIFDPQVYGPLRRNASFGGSRRGNSNFA